FAYIKAQAVLAPSIFNLDTWQKLTHIGQPAYHPYWMPTLLFELVFNSLIFVYSILLLVLFFKRRAAWPRCYIGFFVITVCGLVIDYALGTQIPAAAGSLGDSIKTLGQSLFAAIIWIPYCLVSKRVKATFRF